MGSSRETYGTLLPVGGGDPIPLVKLELKVGRRPVCDIQLDFDNVSGKHAVLSLVNGVWNVRDTGSTNGTTVNGARLSSSHSIMPEDEVGFAGHLYTIDYVPSVPDSLLTGHQVLEENRNERRQHSLMELAGLDTDGRSAPVSRPRTAPSAIDQPSAEDVEFADFADTVPKDFKPRAAAKAKKVDDDDFLKLIEDEVVNRPEG